jgi:hypothetical protein
MGLGISERVERLVRIAVGLYFGIAALSDLHGSTVLLPGIAPLECGRRLQVFTGLVILACAGLLFRRTLARSGVIPLVGAYTLRSAWYLTGPERWAVVWPLLLPGLAIILSWRPEKPEEGGDGKEDPQAR